MLALQINKIKLTDPLVDIAFSRKMVQTLSETPQEVDKKTEQMVFLMEQFTSNQSLQIAVSWKEIAVIQYSCNRGRWLRH
uniref:Uncharacterized protein n=1 Tax=Rhizophora mucronata TaxID=61149 RepID=A0A2P2JP62_RHIMU